MSNNVKQCKTLLILKAVNRNSYDDLALEIAVMARRNNGFPDENGFLDYSMEFSPDSNHLVVNDNTKIKVYNLRQQNSTKILDEAKGEESWKCIAVSPDGKLVLGGGDKGTIKIWDLKTGTLTKTFKYHPVPIQALAIDPKTNKLISISADNLIREWKL
jgi:WD40 repeat protein